MTNLIAEDTDLGAFTAQVQLYRRLGPEGRVALAVQLSEQAREISKAGIQMRHPDYSEDDLAHALYRMLLGDDLYRAAWPRHALVKP